MQNTIAKDTLREYVMRNEVVFQAFGQPTPNRTQSEARFTIDDVRRRKTIVNLVEVANEAEKENREELLAYFDDASSVEVYQKGHRFIKDELVKVA